jgi:SMI1-KNR4 cell-wall
MNIEKVFEKLRNLHQSPPLPTRLPSSTEVNDVEKTLGVKLHPDFRKYLLEVSDVCVGTLEPVTITLPKVHTDLVAVTQAARKLGIGTEFVPICHDNGDYFLISPNGEVFYWSHHGTTDERWPDISTWISKVWIEEK